LQSKEWWEENEKKAAELAPLPSPAEEIDVVKEDKES
jgi:hypothetical protein